jgi:hypothetical protein
MLLVCVLQFDFRGNFQKIWYECYATKDLLGFEVLTAVSMQMAVFWVVAPCSLVEVY